MSGPRIAGLVLAAGGSRRMGTPKQLLTDRDGVPLVVRAARALRAGGCDPVLVVIGAHAAALRDALRGESVDVVEHTGWDSGMGTSIAHAVHTLATRDDARDVTALLIAACDMPSADLTADVAHVTALIDTCEGGSQRVASAWTDEAGARITGVPAVLPRRDWPALEALTGETGARALLREPGGLSVFVRTRNYDLDTPDALEAWQAAERADDARSH